jgi:hypothetical protein
MGFPSLEDLTFLVASAKCSIWTMAPSTCFFASSGFGYFVMKLWRTIETAVLVREASRVLI